MPFLALHCKVDDRWWTYSSEGQHWRRSDWPDVAWAGVKSIANKLVVDGRAEETCQVQGSIYDMILTILWLESGLMGALT